MRRQFKVGDMVIYRKPKVSTHPTLNAVEVHPAEHGDMYAYQVDKYWVVARELDEEAIEVKTRTGKLHRVDRNDPRLRKAGLWARLLRRGRFPRC